MPKVLLDFGPGSAGISESEYGAYPSNIQRVVPNIDSAGLGTEWTLIGCELATPTVGGGVFRAPEYALSRTSGHASMFTSASCLSGIIGDFTIVLVHDCNNMAFTGSVTNVVLAAAATAEFPVIAGHWTIRNVNVLSDRGISFTFRMAGGLDAAVTTPNGYDVPNSGPIEIRITRIGSVLSMYIDDDLKATTTIDATPMVTTGVYLSVGTYGQGLHYIPNDYGTGNYGKLWIIGGSGFAIGADPTVGSVISDICQRAGLDVGSIDVTGLTETLRGYALTNVSSARSNLEPLLKAFFIDVVESDGKLKFRKRSGITSSASIPMDDLGASENDTGDADVMPLRRTQEAEMPRSVSVSFINQNSDYQPGTEVSRRIVTDSINDVTTDLPMAVDAVRAATVADALLFDAWTERNKRSFKVGRKYAALDAGDVVSIEHPAGTWTAKRITRAVDAGAVIECDAVDSDASVYTVVPVGATPAIPQAGVAYPFMTLLEPMNIPILADADDGFGMYVALGSNEAAWPGASLYIGADDSTLAERGGVQSAAIMGLAQTALAAWTNKIFDEKNTVDVLVYSGALANATRDAVLDSGANMALLGSEIIQFRTATMLSAGSYRLSGLLRGVRGTEGDTAAHAINERFILLDHAVLVRVTFELAQLNLQRTFRGVTVGQPVNASAAVLDVCDGEGAMPFAPVNLRRTTASNDITLTWDRRTRSSSTFPANGLDVPLFEAAESYSVDVYTTSGFTTVVRTITATTPTITYTSAQQTSDGLTPGAVVNVRVYQVGAAGRRNYLQGTL